MKDTGDLMGECEEGALGERERGKHKRSGEKRKANNRIQVV